MTKLIAIFGFLAVTASAWAADCSPASNANQAACDAIDGAKNYRDFVGPFVRITAEGVMDFWNFATGSPNPIATDFSELKSFSYQAADGFVSVLPGTTYGVLYRVAASGTWEIKRGIHGSQAE